MFNPYFWCKKTLLSPHMNRLKRLCDLFCIHKDNQLQSSNFACPRIMLALGNPSFSYFQNIVIEKLNTLKYFFPLKSVRGHQNLLSIQTKNMPTSCPHSQHLFWHMSSQSTSMLTLCQNSQRLHGHSIKLNFLLLLSKDFIYFQT